MATIRKLNYENLLKYPLEYCYQFTFAKFRLFSLKTQNVRKPPHANVLNFPIQTVLSIDVYNINYFQIIARDPSRAAERA